LVSIDAGKIDKQTISDSTVQSSSSTALRNHAVLQEALWRKPPAEPRRKSSANNSKN
jgi:hypothetical protein